MWIVEFAWKTGTGEEAMSHSFQHSFATREEAYALSSSFRPNENATIAVFERMPEHVVAQQAEQRG